jgi:FGGY-family pentulose kinase
MDHRAEEQANKINETGAEALKYVGGKISLEMEIPKILWLKENLKESYDKVTDFFDLPDFLVYKACGQKVRSVCSLGCKWTYLAHEKKWDTALLEEIGLEDLMINNGEKIGNNIQPIGNIAGKLTKEQAEKMGLVEGIAVGVSMIDAHAGGVGIIGINLETRDQLKNRVALISGTSNCHMAVSEEATFVPGVWGPYYDAMLPNMWLLEGGQSTAGALIDHVIKNHGAYEKLVEDSKSKNISVYENLNNLLNSMKKDEVDYLTKDIHTLPYFLGNRSPIADPSLRGVMTGLTMDISIENLALHYYSTVQAIAYGTKHIIDEMNKGTFDIKEIYITGGGTKNPLLLQAYANVTGCKIIMAKEEESVLLGASILGAVAGKEYKDIFDAMNNMIELGKVIEPNLKTKEYHTKKYLVFRELYFDYKKYKEMMI